MYILVSGVGEQAYHLPIKDCSLSKIPCPRWNLHRPFVSHTRLIALSYLRCHLNGYYRLRHDYVMSCGNQSGAKNTHLRHLNQKPSTPTFWRFNVAQDWKVKLYCQRQEPLIFGHSGLQNAVKLRMVGVANLLKQTAVFLLHRPWRLGEPNGAFSTRKVSNLVLLMKRLHFSLHWVWCPRGACIRPSREWALNDDEVTKSGFLSSRENKRV